jgi:signal peptidase
VSRALRACARVGRALVRCLATAVLVGLVAVLVVAFAPRLWGYRSLVVRSDSMRPAAPVGSVVVARPIQPAQVRVGQLILVPRRQRPGKEPLAPLLHRVVAVEHDHEGVVVQTKGDANPTPDPARTVLRGATVTPVYVVPMVGYIMGFAATPGGWFVIVLLPASLLCGTMIAGIWRDDEETPSAQPAPSRAPRRRRVAGRGAGWPNSGGSASLPSRPSG